MFKPSREQVRQFFIEVWRKQKLPSPLSSLESIAADIIIMHPEYHCLLNQGEQALQYEYSPESGQMNPFLHLSLHLAIEEQLSIDQPPGIRSAFNHLHRQRGHDRHAALHDVLESLAECIWHAQRENQALDGAVYLESVLNRLSKNQ